ncbi:helix-turn-helix domain-containing protein [Brevibacillus sp. TJ4]|uniref:helix-turn-helix domain-containing protein n=1 Tax=Brevibacillus sp. TJ4 TaxID=3234853 RepID=UPI0037D82F28
MFNGAELRELRKEKQLTLQNLADQTGLSVSLLSQIERGLVDPTVGTFWKICSALDVPFHHFFRPQSNPDPIIRKGMHKLIQLKNSKTKYQVLTPLQEGRIEFLLIEIEPGQALEQEQISHSGEECGYILQGELKVLLGDREYHLYEGDSIGFNSTSPHRFVNPGSSVSRAIWARAT